MKYIYFFIFCILIALIIAFKNYKRDMYAHFSIKDAPLKFVYGFAMLFIPKKAYNESLKLTLKTASTCICTFTVLIFIGLICSLSTATSSADKDTKGSLYLKDETGTSVESSTILNSSETEYDYVKETVLVFEKYRKDIEAEFLGENDDFFFISKPLNLLSEYGEEKICIQWEFETPNIVDENGNILYDNIGSDGCSTIAYAHLSMNDLSATLSIPIYICPP